MKDLYITNEMQKFQDTARKVYAEKKAVEIDAVRIGWKIETGRVLYDAALDATITIVDEPQRNLFKINMASPKGTRDGEANITQLASLILNNKVAVYYSK